jgi:hypothetical protein
MTVAFTVSATPPGYEMGIGPTWQVVPQVNEGEGIVPDELFGLAGEFRRSRRRVVDWWGSRMEQRLLQQHSTLQQHHRRPKGLIRNA